MVPQPHRLTGVRVRVYTAVSIRARQSPQSVRSSLDNEARQRFQPSGLPFSFAANEVGESERPN